MEVTMKKLSALFIMAVILGTIELSFADPFEFVKLWFLDV